MYEKQGWINLYKPKNISSHKSLNLIKKKFLLNKIGHAGTLDPLAQGILPVAIGKTTKLIPFIGNELKKYKFTVGWGKQTTTDDSAGEILNRSNLIPKKNDIIPELNKFLGNFEQVPPHVSAVKINGNRAYKLVRENRVFSIKPRKVFVKNLKLIEHDNKLTTFEIESGKGFYVRSFARDLGIILGTYGYIVHLERLKVGKFTKDSSILLDDLIKIGQRLTDINCIKPSISMLDDILAFEIEDQQNINLISMGRSIRIDEKILGNYSSNLLEKKTIFLSNNGDVVSFGKLIGNLFKPIKVLI